MEGPTPIDKGNATAAGDITVVNENLAFALAVQSAVPYGVARGALVDLAPVTDGRIGRDRVVFADFIPDNWSAWPNTFHRVAILERGPQRAVIRTERDWGSVVIVTVYTLLAGEDHVDIEVTMTNGGKTPVVNLLSGLTLWPNSGFLFGIPGLQGVTEGDAAAALAHRVVAYDQDWAVALHADYFDRIADGSKDLYLRHTLNPGESRRFEGWLQVRPAGDLGPVIAAEIDRGRLASGSVRGVVSGHDGEPIEQPVIVVESHGKPYGWAMGCAGQYQLTLPRGEYTLYATAKNYSQSAKAMVKVAASAAAVQDFHDLRRPGSLSLAVTNQRGEPVDARINIVEGQRPLVEFLGRRTFFTELSRRGRLEVPIAPGDYTFDVTSGGGFFGAARAVAAHIESAHTHLDAALDLTFDPAARHWYGADLHHHADQAEAVTPPEDLARSQLAAGLNVLFVSDHDSTVNHRPLQHIAEHRRIPFIAGVELSPSWGHFNAYPVRLGAVLQVDPSIATVDQIFAEARRLGARVVQVNHPFIPYGYLTSVATGVAPGGFNPAFDLLEINATAPDDDDKVLHAAWDYWSAGQRYYLSAGTDTHDVWNAQSGAVRVFAHVDGPLTADAFVAALRNGHSYVSHGPLIYPSVVFGDSVTIAPGGEFKLTLDLRSVTGLRHVDLIAGGRVISNRAWVDGPHTARAAFALTAQQRWYALEVEDVAGHRAYTNPIWVTAAPYKNNNPQSKPP